MDFKGLNFNNETVYHSITTDHIYMNEIGLSSFTLPQLYDWMSQRDSKGEFVNLKYFDGVNFQKLQNGETVQQRILTNKLGKYILGSDKCSDEAWMYFSQWIKGNKSGRYEQTRYDKWKYYNKYTYIHIHPSLFKNKIFFLEKHDDSYYLEPKNNEQGDIDDWISVIVSMNDIARLLPGDSRYYSNQSEINREYLAAEKFINDIKLSAEKCLQWCAKIKFRMEVPGQNPCIKEECVHFKLHLYDFKNNKSLLARPTAINSNNFYIAIPKIDVHGRIPSLNTTGGFTVPNPNVSPNKTDWAIGQLDLTLNQNTGKVEAGSPIILVKLDKDLPAAQWTSSTTPSTMASENGHVPGIGIAIPVQQQNSNPLQWASQYATQCADSSSVFNIIIQNHYEQIFPSGAMGYATRLNNTSQWSFVPIGSYTTKNATIANTYEPKWSFTYLMMNNDNFFHDLRGNKFIPENYEKDVYTFYYEQYKSESEKIKLIENLTHICPLQVTSWDFMGSSVGGLRSNGHALSSTVYNLRLNGEIIGDNGGQGMRTAPFFGCVFPNGYNAKVKYDAYMQDRNIDFVVQKTLHPYNLSEMDFIQKIDKTIKIFDNNTHNDSAAIPDDAASGIFYNNAQNGAFNHLPADIALNAAPDSKFGSPLINFYRIFQAFQAPTDPTNYIQKISDLAIGSGCYIWLHEDGNPKSSTFNFEPNVGFKLQFRPLKNEIYDAFQTPGNWNFINGGQFNGTGIFSYIATQYTKSKTSPIYKNAIKRSQLLQPNGPYDFGKMMAKKNVGDDNLSLRFNNTLYDPVSDLEAGYYSQPYWGAVGGSYTSGPFKPQAPAGAFGIIGVVCTVYATDNISFDTSNLFGVGDWFLNGRWYRSFGGAGDSYDSIQNTQLYVRIFESWPREYTVYDPSKFAIFHFNTNDEIDFGYKDFYFMDNSNKIYINQDRYKVHQIFNDAINFGIDITPKELKYEINKSRLRKLLPHTYTMEHSIGIPITTIKRFDIEENNTIKAKDCDIFIYDWGQNYKESDRFIIIGGAGTSPELKPKIGTGLLNGRIIGFEYAENSHNGYGYNQSDFLKYDDIIYNPTNSTSITSNDCSPRFNNINLSSQSNNFPGLVIVPKGIVSGTGLVARVVRGTATRVTLQDLKPKEIGTITQLTPNIGITEEFGTTNKGPCVASKSTSVAVKNISKNNKYDLFFHFHNDTSHTWIEPNSSMGMGPSFENYVELTISPN